MGDTEHTVVARRGWTGAQVRAIAAAVLRARAAVSRGGEPDPAGFARMFVREGGVQVPGGAAAARLGALGAALPDAAAGEATPADPDLAREVLRVRREAALAAALASPRMVGFLVSLVRPAESDPVAAAVAGQDFGLGAGVWPRSRAAVLPPWCTEYALTPLSENEVEQ